MTRGLPGSCVRGTTAGAAVPAPPNRTPPDDALGEQGLATYKPEREARQGYNSYHVVRHSVHETTQESACNETVESASRCGVSSPCLRYS